MMNKIQSIRNLLLTIILTIGIDVLTGDNAPANADKNIWKDDDTMKELVKDIDNGKDDDDDMDWDEFKDSKIYKLEDKETKECVEGRAELGNSLADYEILRCFEDSDYYEEEY